MPSTVIFSRSFFAILTSNYIISYFPAHCKGFFEEKFDFSIPEPGDGGGVGDGVLLSFREKRKKNQERKAVMPPNTSAEEGFGAITR